jgi:hypothetical protein
MTKQALPNGRNPRGIEFNGIGKAHGVLALLPTVFCGL